MWKKISIYTTIEGLDIVLGRLDALGITQAEIDEGIEAIDSYLHDAAEFWDYADPEEINECYQTEADYNDRLHLYELLSLH